MVAGPAALAVAFVLLPGWVYWRLEASPRTARTALGEFFEVVAAGALASGATILAYVSLPDGVRGHRIGDRLINPAELSAEFVQDHLTKVSWTIAVMVAAACGLAALVAGIQKHFRDDQSTYAQEVPIWVETLGDTDRVLTVDMRDGRRLTGYLGGHSVEEDGTPSVFLTPPLRLETPTPRPYLRRSQSETTGVDFPRHAVTIPGSEIVGVWREWDDDDADV